MTKTSKEYMAWTRHHWTLTFFYCLLIALFVTVCIYTYAGQQQNLSTRNFGNVVVNGLDTTVTELITDTTSGSTLTLKGDKQRTFFFESDPDVSDLTLTLPSRDDIINLMPVKTNGAFVDFGNIINQRTGDIIVTVPTGITNIGSGATINTGDNFNLGFMYQDGNLLWTP